jgi:RNA polymerase sigma-70 factor, ECF subfamily
MSLESLITESKHGSTDAFRLLYEQLADKVFRFVRARSHSRDDALDILQDVFVDFWKSLRQSQFQYSTDAQVYAFLYTIASRKLSRYYRFRFFQRQVVSLDVVEDILPTVGISGDINGEDQSAKQDVLDLANALPRLRANDREIIQLRYFAGLPFAEIADLLGESENTLKVRHHRALERLHHELRK